MTNVNCQFIKKTIHKKEDHSSKKKFCTCSRNPKKMEKIGERMIEQSKSLWLGIKESLPH